MPTETRSPEAVAREWLNTVDLVDDLQLVRWLSDLLRREREAAFDAGMKAGRSRKLERLVSGAKTAKNSALLHHAGKHRDELEQLARERFAEASEIVTAARQRAVEREGQRYEAVIRMCADERDAARVLRELLNEEE